MMHVHHCQLATECAVKLLFNNLAKCHVHVAFGEIVSVVVFIYGINFELG
jgi:hypothetical protein